MADSPDTGIRDLLQLLHRHDVLSLAGGTPDPDLLPLEALRKAYDRALSDPQSARMAVQYSEAQGLLELRISIAGLMAAEGVSCSAANIAITAGAQQALDLLAKLFVSAGDVVAVQRPTYLGAIQAFRAYEPEFVDLSVERSPGVAPPRLAYVVSDFANPTGLTLSLNERRALLQRAETWNAVVVEDAAYRPLRYRGRPEPSLLTLNCQSAGGLEEARTVYCGTLSKTLSPALRLGWVCGPTWIIEGITLLQQGADVHASTINQMVAADILAGDFESHLQALRTAYSERADALSSALDRNFSGLAHWRPSQGGFFVWMTLPSEIDTSSLLERSIRDAGVAFVPGQAFFATGPQRSCLRLSCSALAPHLIDEAVARLARLATGQLTAAAGLLRRNGLGARQHGGSVA